MRSGLTKVCVSTCMYVCLCVCVCVCVCVCACALQNKKKTLLTEKIKDQQKKREYEKTKGICAQELADRYAEIGRNSKKTTPAIIAFPDLSLFNAFNKTNTTYKK